MNDLNVIHASQLARISDHGEPRRGAAQGALDLIADGAVIIRDGTIVAVGETPELVREWGGDVRSFDATGLTVLPGLIECHSHPLFAGERHAEYAQRLAGVSLAEIARGEGVEQRVGAREFAVAIRPEDERPHGLIGRRDRFVRGPCL